MNDSNLSSNEQNLPTSPKAMSGLKAGRYQVLFSLYKDSARKLLDLMPNRGKRDFTSVMNRVDNLSKATGKVKECNVALTDAFKGKDFLDASSIANTVCSVRQRFGLPRLTGNILKQAVHELDQLFFLEEKMVTNQLGKRERQYRPAFALLV